MSLSLNLLKSKSFGPAPAGPIGIHIGGMPKTRAAGFASGQGHGLSLSKKGSAGHKAGLGRPGRAVKTPSMKLPGVTLPGRALPGTGGKAALKLNPNPSVRLPNRQTFGAPAKKPSAVSNFFRRFRRG